MRLILASKSPQRATLLTGIGVAFDVIPSSVDEDSHPELRPAERAAILAREKAADVARSHPGEWVLGCDTLVEAPDGTLLEKATDADDARRMLRLMSGKMSVVHSGLCLRRGDDEEVHGLSSSRVWFKPLSDADIEWWIESGHWRDRSGSFQIDGLGQLLITSIEGDWTGIVGLPVFLLGQLAEEAGIDLRTIRQS